MLQWFKMDLHLISEDIQFLRISMLPIKILKALLLLILIMAVWLSSHILISRIIILRSVSHPPVRHCLKLFTDRKLTWTIILATVKYRATQYIIRKQNKVSPSSYPLILKGLSCRERDHLLRPNLSQPRIRFFYYTKVWTEWVQGGTMDFLKISAIIGLLHFLRKIIMESPIVHLPHK
jgi:hypothetical protein